MTVHHSLERAAEILNDALAATADVFSTKFHAPATIKVGDVSFTYRKDGNGYGFFCGDTPISSTSLRLRMLLAQNIEKLWEACEQSEESLHEDLDRAIAVIVQFCLNKRTSP